MREIGTIAREQEAGVLADYLLTFDITTKLERRSDGWAVWVHREDRVTEARAVLAEFAADPNAERFTTSGRAAREIREQKERDERAYLKQTKKLRDRWEGSMSGRAPLTFGLIIASVVVTAGMQFFPSLTEHLYFSTDRIDPTGAIVDTGVTAIRQGEIWRLLTPIFLHFGIIHLFFNMMALRFLGERIEMVKGSWRLALIALVAALAGNVGQFFESGGNFGGMSGVVFALAGYCWVKGYTDPEDGLSLDQRNVFLMVGILLIGVLSSMNGGTASPQIVRLANVAHAVGLGVGMVFGLLRL